MPALDPGRRDSDLVYDLGFHDGGDTAFYLGRGYRVVAVDANPEAIREGGLRFAPQLRDGRLTLVNVAIVESGQTEATLYVSDQREWTSVRSEAAGRGGTGITRIRVPAITLAALVEQFGSPLYLKIDIEGMDEVALENLASTSVRPRFISVEAECIGEAEPTETDALRKLDLLVELGYSRFKLVDQDSLRVLSMDDLDLGPRRTLGAKGRARLDRLRGRKRTAVLRIADQMTIFPIGASGPFGDDLAGEWIDKHRSRTLLVAARRAYFARADARADGFWCDWHATT